MVKKHSVEIPDLVEDHAETQKIESKPENLPEGDTNLSVKAEMAKELNLSGFSDEAIGRLLHLSKDEVENILEISGI